MPIEQARFITPDPQEHPLKSQGKYNIPTHRAGLATALVALATVVTSPARAGPDVGVSVQISQPGVYGRVDIGRFPQPQVVVTQPVIITHSHTRPEPVYMWVPPGHRKKWSRYCGRYSACGVPVYFVEDHWYQEHVHQRREERREGGWERGPDHGHEQSRGHDGDRGERGRGHGHGRGH